MIFENLTLTPTLRSRMQRASWQPDMPLCVEQHRNPEHNAAPFVVVLPPKTRSSSELTDSETAKLKAIVAEHRVAATVLDTATLAKNAGSAAATVARMRDAFADEATGQEAALVALRDAVWPALDAITTATTFEREFLTTHRCIRLGDDRTGNRTLYLRDDGQFLLSTDESVAEVETKVAASMGIWPIEGWVGMLALKCDAVAEGMATKRAAAATKRAELLKALAIILGSLKTENGR